MANLSVVAAAVLRDLTAAQDLANRYSRDLGAEYRNDQMLRLFPVPRARVQGAELDLRVAFQDPIVDPMHLARNLVVAEETFESHAPALASAAADRIVAGVQSLLAGDPTRAQLLLTLMTNLRSAYYLEHLATKISRALFDARETILDRNNDLDPAGASAAIVAAVDDELRRHPDLAPLFAANDPARSAVGAALVGAIGGVLAEITIDLHGTGTLRDDYTAEVIVDTAQLAVLPEGVISTLKINLDVQGFTWTVVDGSDRLLPQG